MIPALTTPARMHTSACLNSGVRIFGESFQYSQIGCASYAGYEIIFRDGQIWGFSLSPICQMQNVRIYLADWHAEK